MPCCPSFSPITNGCGEVTDQASVEAAPFMERKCVSMGAWIVVIPTFVPVLYATCLLSDDHAGTGTFATLLAMSVSRAVLALMTWSVPMPAESISRYSIDAPSGDHCAKPTCFPVVSGT